MTDISNTLSHTSPNRYNADNKIPFDRTNAPAFEIPPSKNHVGVRARQGSIAKIDGDRDADGGDVMVLDRRSETKDQSSVRDSG
jgi:hypothetical protein